MESQRPVVQVKLLPRRGKRMRWVPATTLWAQIQAGRRLWRPGEKRAHQGRRTRIGKSRSLLPIRLSLASRPMRSGTAPRATSIVDTSWPCGTREGRAELQRGGKSGVGVRFREERGVRVCVLFAGSRSGLCREHHRGRARARAPAGGGASSLSERVTSDSADSILSVLAPS